MRNFTLVSKLLVILLFFASNVFGVTITVNNVTTAPFCPGQVIQVIFSNDASPGGGNKYSVQLSDASGSFASPTTISAADYPSTAINNNVNYSTAASTTITIPAGTSYGTGYKIRVASSKGLQTQIDFGPFAIGQATYTVSGDATLCTGPTNVTLSSSESGVTYELYKDGVATGTTQVGTGAALNFSVSVSGVYTVRTTTAGGYCAQVMSGSATITIDNSPPSITSETLGGATYSLNNPATPLSVTATGATSYQWYSNTVASNSGGTLISGATASNYTPPTNVIGTTYYYVVVTGPCGTPNYVTSNVSGAIIVIAGPDATLVFNHLASDNKYWQTVNGVDNTHELNGDNTGFMATPGVVANSGQANEVSFSLSTYPSGTLQSQSAGGCAVESGKQGPARLGTSGQYFEVRATTEVITTVDITLAYNSSSGTGIIGWAYYDASDAILSSGTFNANGYSEACSHFTETPPAGTTYLRLTRNSYSFRIYDAQIWTSPACSWEITTWDGDTDADWNNASNWNNGVPCCTWKAIIPDVTTVTYYPTISTTACCDTILFQPGAGVLGLQNLTYNKAFVQMEASRDHWYTLTPPLKQMYSGDLYFDETPQTYARLFDSTSPDAIGPNITYEGKFTRSFASLDIPISPLEGIAFKMSQKTCVYLSGCTYIATDTIITYPRINPDGSLVTAYIPHSAYNYMPYTFITKTVTKDATAYRFAAENGSNLLVDKSCTLPTGLSLVGNPIMTHLNISDFLTTNYTTNNVISNYIKLWTGSAYETYDGVTDSWDGSYTGDLIAPLQSFIVNSPAGGDILFDLDVHFNVDDDNSQLRSANTEKENMLFIKAIKDGKTTGTVVSKHTYADNSFDSKDIFKLFTPLNEISDIYTLAEGYALSFNKFKTYPFTTPLGIKTTDFGKVKLEFSGAESFIEAEVYLINASEGTEQNLKENPSYEINLDGTNQEGELFISFRSAGVSTENINATKNNGIQIYVTDETKIKIESSPSDLIRDIIVFGLSGKIIEQHCCFLNTPKFEILAHKNQFYLVQVYTEKNSKLEKILVK